MNCLYAWRMDKKNLPKPLRFIRRGATVSMANVPPSRTLLEVLREDLRLTGTKEGCNEGDCGACAVVLGEAVASKLEYRVVNSCIRLAHAIDGLALWTVQDLAAPDGALHPAQAAMVDNHGSQCGFCTPGFVMSLFGLYQNHVRRGRTVTRELAQQALSGNLCRCTGYRPILDAAQRMAQYPTPVDDDAATLGLLKSMASAPSKGQRGASYMLPRTLRELLQVRAAHPDAQLVAGCTDVGLWVTKMHRQMDKILDLTRTLELRRVESYPHHIAIGAAVTLADAYAALADERPQLKVFADRFAGLPVRNAGTLGGNLANGSPIGDSMPLLIALGASVLLMSWRDGRMLHREIPLERLYTGYRKNLMAPDEVLAWVKVPRPRQETLRAYKISKRFEDDISAVCLVVNLTVQDGHVTNVGIGAGGVAATPARAVHTEAALLGQPWNQRTVEQAMAALRAEFRPIDDMRASSAYRHEVLGNLLQRFWLESQGAYPVNLESFDPADIANLEALA
jgi:xanthine dehydrogenase small subunit